MFRQDLTLASPWMNAAGTLGFAPGAAAGARWTVAAAQGAFVTNPISLAPRTPAADRCLMTYPGGVLLHTGLPNPGFSRVLRRSSARWAQSHLPIWPHLIGARPEEIHEMVRRLEGLDGVAAVELGLPPDASEGDAAEFVRAAAGELPVVVHLPLTIANEAWLALLPGLGASAVSLGGPRGSLFAANGDPRLIRGRLYGPALLPQMLAAVVRLRRLGIPVIAGAGIYRAEDAQALLAAGARAVQLDTVLWRGWNG
jgi:dihydroorotate dehydrogenase (NAD+) catalytic subunit